jgi:hypothetical protein
MIGRVVVSKHDRIARQGYGGKVKGVRSWMPRLLKVRMNGHRTVRQGITVGNQGRLPNYSMYYGVGQDEGIIPGTWQLKTDQKMLQ